MRAATRWRKLASSNLAVLAPWAAVLTLPHTATNGQYGFHRDELATVSWEE